MPLADTKPSSTETAVDDWIRLIKAIDTTVEALKKQGKTNNPSGEVGSMLITHCPDPGQSLVFSSRPLEWTAADVQARLDEHCHKKRLQQPIACILPR